MRRFAVAKPPYDLRTYLVKIKPSSIVNNILALALAFALAH